MGALFGFSGPIDTSLLHRMAAALSHRGQQALKSHASPYGSIGYRPQFEEPLSQRHGAGLYHSGD